MTTRPRVTTGRRGMRRDAALWPALVATLALVLGLRAGPAAAGAWTQPAGSGQLVLSFFHSDSPKSYDANGRLSPRPDYRKSELYALYEYGLTDRLTLILTPSLQDIRSGQDRQSGLGYSDLGLRYRLLQQGGWVGAVQALARLPQGDADNRPQLSDSDTQYEVRGLLGKGFQLGGHDAFVNLEAAYRLRMGAPPNELRLDLTAGYRLTPALQLLAQSFTTVSAGGGAAGQSFYDDTKLQLSLAYDLDPATTLQAGLLATVAGRNTLRERGLMLALWHRF